MTAMPQSLRSNLFPLFPATVMGGGPVTVNKANGIWTIALNLIGLGPIQAGFDPSTKYLLIFDATTNTWIQGPISTVFGAQLPRIVTAAGVVTATAADYAILMNKIVGAATTINLPTAASRTGLPLIIKDYKGDADTNNITVVANGAETIDGFDNATAQANGTSKLVSKYERKVFYPLQAGGWYV